MKFPPLAADYSKLRFSNRNCKEFRHIKLILFWPLFGIAFVIAERFFSADSYTVIHCAWDDRIPFSEIFILPYVFWYFYLVGMHLFTFLYDTEAFSKMVKFFIFNFTAAMLICFLFPNCQQLRPDVFPRDNILTDLVKLLYQVDTSTNVFPSMHVMGSLAVVFTAFHCKVIHSKRIKAGFVIVSLLICISTVFLKQHSLLDVLGALPICGIGYLLFFRTRK